MSPHWQEEPVARLRKYLLTQGAWSRTEEDAALADATATVDQAVAAYLATPKRPAASMFDHLFATLPPALASQRAELGDA